jgi:hypothetical protein
MSYKQLKLNKNSITTKKEIFMAREFTMSSKFAKDLRKSLEEVIAYKSC